jgi:beta-glucosidase
MNKPQQLRFPKGFLWGSSMSSHQVEGDTFNDWSEWEQSEKRLHDLQESGALEQHSINNFISGTAAKHFHLYKEDYRLAKELGHNTLRISLEWSRIEPNEGLISVEALGRYREMIRHMKEIGIEPIVTLWHWTIPLWLRDKGGWLNPKTPEFFARYAEQVVRFFGSGVTFWVTLNEPEIYTANSYLNGIWPPQKSSLIQYFRVLHNLVRGHKKAYERIKSLSANAKVGIAKNNIHFTPHEFRWFNRVFSSTAHWWWNDYFLRKISEHQDFIGLNYYFRSNFHLWKIRNDNKEVSDLGWELYPEGIYHVLKDLKKFGKPIYITENGLADAGDKKRSWFIAQILQYVHQAIGEGVDVRGYLHWSLIDNFEWDKGFYPRFGLVEVDYKTQKRTPRNSAKFYADIIKNNGLDPNHGLS